jgi:hypothetical protein
MTIHQNAAAPNTFATEAPETSEQAQKSFTSRKLDWTKSLRACRRAKSRDKVIGECIAHHINAETGTCYPSIETISDETHIPQSSVRESIKRLRKLGWIDWKRTGDSNTYWLLNGNLAAIAAEQAELKARRQERRKATKNAWRKKPDDSRDSGDHERMIAEFHNHERRDSGDPDSRDSGYKHLNRTPQQNTLKKDAVPAAGAAHSDKVIPIADTPEKRFFIDSVRILGNNGRSLAALLLKAKGGNINDAHAALLTSANKAEPREWLGRVIKGKTETGGNNWDSF